MKYLKIVAALFIYLLVACSNDTNTAEEVIIDDEIIDEVNENPLIGFNVRWRNTPKLSSKLLKYVDSLKPDLMRYPGGTITHKWNWKEGLPNQFNSNDYVHKIEDVKKMADSTNSNIIFVLDVAHGTIEDQLEMMNQANVPVKHIELGNELYADEYETIFPNGKAYADTVNSWTPILRNHFPNAKIGAVMIGRTAGNDRKNLWNIQTFENLKVDIDAFIYHFYVNDTESVQQRINRFKPMFIENTGKELWVTEYGAHSHTVSQINELADYIESIADIALSHCLISGSGNFSKITEDIEYTYEGLEYLKRNNPLVN